MGWFGDACRSLGRKVGRGVEKVGIFLGSKTIEKIGRGIQDACAEKVAEERSYEKETANIYSTDRLNEILVSFSEGYYQQATAIENACIENVKNYYEDIIQLLEQASHTAKIDTNLKRLKREKSRVGDHIHGAIKDQLAKKMSLDNTQCLEILKMDAGEEKRKAMTKFSQKIINEALDNLSKQVRRTLDEQMEWIEDYLANISEEQERAFSALKERYDKMLQDDYLEENNQERYCIEPLFVLNTNEKIGQILAEGDRMNRWNTRNRINKRDIFALKSSMERNYELLQSLELLKALMVDSLLKEISDVYGTRN